jgi:hypothetical protein
MARRKGLYEVDGELVSERTPPARWHGFGIRAGVWLGAKLPGQRIVVGHLEEPGRDVNERVPVAPAGLDRQYFRARIPRSAGWPARSRPADPSPKAPLVTNDHHILAHRNLIGIDVLTPHAFLARAETMIPTWWL